MPQWPNLSHPGLTLGQVERVPDPALRRCTLSCGGGWRNSSTVSGLEVGNNAPMRRLISKRPRRSTAASNKRPERNSDNTGLRACRIGLAFAHRSSSSMFRHEHAVRTSAAHSNGRPLVATTSATLRAKPIAEPGHKYPYNNKQQCHNHCKHKRSRTVPHIDCLCQCGSAVYTQCTTAHKITCTKDNSRRLPNNTRGNECQTSCNMQRHKRTPKQTRDIEQAKAMEARTTTNEIMTP